MISIILPYSKPGIAYSGPLQSIIGVCHFLEGKYDYQILTKYNNFKESPIEESISEHKVVTISNFNSKTLFSIIQNSEIIWINSIYSIPFSFIPLIYIFLSKKKTVLVSTRGQLLGGSLDFKKRIYLHIYKLLLQRSKNSIYIHYSTKEEKENSYPIFKKFRSLLFANPLKSNFPEIKKQKTDKSEYVIGFLGRIAPIKNIEFIITLMPLLPDYMVFHIYGVIVDNAYKKKLEKLVFQLGLEERVIFKGEYLYKELEELYTYIDLAVVPSKSESFCYAFFEAIENKKPVIGSTGLPWKKANTFEPNTILPLEKEKWIKQINNIVSAPHNIDENRQKNLEQFYNFVLKSIEDNVLVSFESLVE
jgi:glycosyltransferase involved in cell wall biosynthesis|tara:strand:- start:39044 stop:40129 length:1086 start_codon:yes stop_codon:yes gene_type:complete